MKIQKSDLGFYAPNGSIVVIMDGVTNANFPERKCLVHTPLELLKVVDFKNLEDFYILAKMYKTRDVELPAEKAVFHISEIDVNLPQHVNRLIDLYHERKDY